MAGLSKTLLMKVFFTSLAICAAAVLVPGCAGRIPAAEDADFRLRGKLSVRDGSRQAFSASFDWTQTGARYRIDLWGPLGRGRVRLAGDDRTMDFTNARGLTVRNASGADWMQRELGWSAPIASLRHWVLGRHDPRLAVELPAAGEAGTAHRFIQAGWTVDVTRWQSGTAPPLPALLEARRGAQRIVVACKEWTLRRRADSAAPRH